MGVREWGEGFAQRTQRAQRLGKGITEMVLCCSGIDHTCLRDRYFVVFKIRWMRVLERDCGMVDSISRVFGSNGAMHTSPG